VFAADPKGSEKHDQLGGPADTESDHSSVSQGLRGVSYPTANANADPRHRLNRPGCGAVTLRKDHRVYDSRGSPGLSDQSRFGTAILIP
jgi:hypothetical protein